MNEKHQIGKRYSAEVMALAGILWRLVVRALFWPRIHADETRIVGNSRNA